ncbi:hypothetical protein IW146_005674 [Coemansia sp. RSA 922]|nr:hypothetical protein IW146_005674 [Coemansia sp. RSA 922]
MKRCTMDLAGFLANAPSLFGEDEVQGEEIDPDITNGSHAGAIRRFSFSNGDSLSCVRWDERFHITSTDIIRALVHRFEDIQRPVTNIKKFEEGVFSDLRSLKPGVHARLELPRSEFLDLLFKHHCVRTQKKQKVFFWDSVPHDLLFKEALERDLKREAMGVEPTTKISCDADPASHVVIGGVELPLTVPPTLAVHVHSGPTVPGSAPQVLRVSTALVSPPLPQSPATQQPPHQQQRQQLPLSTTSTSLAIVAPTASDSLLRVCKASAVSIASMASSSHDEDYTDTHAMFPESGGRYGDSADMLRFVTSSAAHAQSRVSAPDSGSGSIASSIAGSVVMMPADNNNNQPPVSGDQNCMQRGMFNDLAIANSQQQPSLREYVSGKAMSASSGYSGDVHSLGPGPGGLERTGFGNPLDAVVLNDSWTGMNFEMLRRQASDLRAIYNEYQPTPTPHHSPLMGAANGQELLELLSGDPNALVTQDNVGDFNSLLEELLGKTGRIQEGVLSPGTFAFGSSQPQQFQPFSGWDPSQRLDIPLSALSGPIGPSGSDVDMSGRTPMASAMIESMTSSPSIASMMNNSQHISPHHTPDAMSSLQFHGGGDLFPANGPMSLSDIDNILASAREPSGSAVHGQSALSSMPMFSMDGDFGSADGRNNGLLLGTSLDQQSSFAASLAEARMSTEGSRSNDILKQQWLAQQKSVNTSAPRSSRFSRFHPYLKTIARIAHRDSPSLLNRTPSTADPVVAAAAVNAMAAKFSREEADAAAAAEQQLQWPQQARLMHGTVPVAPRPDGFMPPGVQSAESLSTSQDVDHANIAGPKPSGRNARPTHGAEGDEVESRRYTCTFSGCVKQFKRYEHLKRHFRTHTGERPYKCPAPECDKVFARMDNLNQHIRTHVNRKTANRRAAGGGKAATVAVGVGVGLAEDNVANGLMFADSALFSGNGAASVVSGFGDSGLVLENSSFGEPQPSLYAAVQSPRASARGMRISMPEELSLMGREWFINNSSPPQTTAAALPQPLQSPLMENNAVTMLRKISKNNRQRSVVATTPLGASGGWSAVGRGRDDQMSPYFAADSLGLQPLLQQTSPGDTDEPGFARTLSTDATTASNINTMLVASFLSPELRQQFLASVSQGEMPAVSSSVGFAMSPPPLHPGLAREVAVGRTLSLKRHLDEAENEDVIMSGGSRASSRGEGDEHQMSGSKYVRASVSSKPHVSAV